MKLRSLRRAKQLRNQRPRANKYYDAYIRQAARHLKPGTIIETCGCDVARVLEVDPDSDDIKYESLTRGGVGHCSIFNCAPQRLRPYGATRRIEMFKRGGMKELTMRYYVEDCKMTREAAEAQYNEWHS